MATYEFKLTLSGTGDTEGEAWTDAVDAFCADPGEPESAVNLDDGPEFEDGPGFEGWEGRAGVVTLEQLRQTQLQEYPDSVLLSVDQVLTMCAEISSYAKQISPWRWVATCLANLEKGPVQFYICGKASNNKYRWMGMRYGTKGHEYISGCPINGFDAPEVGDV